MPTLHASKAMSDFLRHRQEDARKIADQIRKERDQAELADTRAHIRAVIDREPADEVEAVERGPTRLLARDGLLWLVSQKRLETHLRMAAEKYRGLYAVALGGHVKSCLAEATGGGDDDTRIRRQVDAAMRLDRARDEALNRDQPMIRLVDEVCGKASTLRDLARGDKHLAASLEVELRVALRLLARHFGYAT